jgi:signal recognition particle subunit SRP54
VDATSGRNMINIAHDFNSYLKISGLVVTKFDGTGKAGSVLSINSLLNLPIKFLGTGEHLTDLEIFYPDRIATRILGMGDIKTLIEKINRLEMQNSETDVMSRIKEGKFNFNDML